MVKRVVVTGLVMAAVLAGPARAGSPWDTPTVTLEMRGIADSDLFPGSTLTSSDRGGQLGGSVESGRRLSKAVKLSLGAEGGGQFWSHFSDASYGWAGANATLRRGGTQLRGDFEWTPNRLKFPAVLDGGAFSRLEGRLGVRQALGEKLRLRLEGRRQQDDFVTAYDVRDGHANELYAQVSLRANPRLTLRADLLESRTHTEAGKYAHDDRVVGGSAALAAGRWQLDGGVWSGTSHYRQAVAGDSNFRRRDQWIQFRGEVRRALGGGLTALAGGEWNDQSSSRPDRSFDENRVQIGLTWTREGQ